MPVEQLIDGMINVLKKNVVARTRLTQDVFAGTGIIKVDNSFHFENVNEIALFDEGGADALNFHTIANIIDTTTIQLLQPVTRDFLVSRSAMIQKALGNSYVFAEDILFGDREVIPNPDRVIITVNPDSLSNNWIYLMGGLDEEYKLTITIYAKDDAFEDGLRIISKFADNIYHLLNNNIHLDIVNDETPLTADVSIGSNTVQIADTSSWPVDASDHRYELQDNENVEIDFAIDSVPNSTDIVLSRDTVKDYMISRKAILRRRVRYLYDSRVDNVDFGYISKDNTIFKAARLSWFCKETEEYGFPEHGRGGIY